MRIIDRIKAKTSKKNRISGQISTAIGVTCATILAAGIVSNPIGIVALTLGTILFGVKSGHHALKVGDGSVEDIDELEVLKNEKKEILKSIISTTNQADKLDLLERLKIVEKQINSVKDSLK
jgi:hypothetical protein